MHFSFIFFSTLKNGQSSKRGKREYQDTKIFFKWEEYDTFSQLHFIKYGIATQLELSN